jgi:hypothetical protein
MFFSFPRSSFLFFLLAFCLSLASCLPAPVASPPPGPTVTYNPFATLSPTPFDPQAETATPLPTFTPTLALPTLTATFAPGTRPRYNMQVMLNYAAHSLSVDEYITYVNAAGVPLETLVLAVEPNRQEGVFALKTVFAPRVSGYDLNGSRLEVRLRPALAPGESLELYLHFNLSLPPADQFHLFGYRNGQMNLVDWYPFIVPYRQGWVLHEPGEAGEHLVYETADFDISISLTGAVTDVVIAAPAAPNRNNYRLTNARTFAFSVGEQLLSAAKMAGETPVTSYFFASEETQGRRVLDEAALALETYRRLFGPSPYPALTIVETDFYDGMEYDGLIFVGRKFYQQDDGTKLNYLIALTAHETAHQWWFGLVGSDQALEPWLDEALATYSEYLFYEQNYPGVAAAWWTFRVDALSPAGFVDLTVYEADDFQSYAGAAYLRGAQFLRDLRARLGDDAFFAFLKAYAAQMAGKIATRQDFFGILASYAGAGIDDWIGEYFRE